MGGESGGGDESVTSPKDRVKFLCSHGGKIMPRPIDGHLKYVGGETRVVAIPRDINFSELMKKLGSLFDGEMVLKYQLIPEDLDALVSVKSDEDLKHMLDEYDRHEIEGAPKFRAFLFPSSQLQTENHHVAIDSPATEQRYIDAINGIIRSGSNTKLTPINGNRPSFSISACSSPKSTSPDSHTLESMPSDHSMTNSYQNNRLALHKVRSSPSLCSLNNPHHQSNSIGNLHYYQHQPQPHIFYQHHHHGYQNSGPPQDPHSFIGHEKLSPTVSLGRADFGRGNLGPGPNSYY